MKKGMKIALTAVVLLGVGAAVAARLMKPEDELVTRELPVVELMRTSVGNVEVETALMGSIQPSDVYYVIPKTAGEIKEIYVQNGDTVAEGDPICRIDNTKQIDAAKIQLDAARVSYDTALSALNRMMPLYQAGDVSAQAYEQTKAQVDGAKLQLDAAQLQYDTQVEFATVTAPADGVVQSSAMTVNGMAAQSSQLCVITASGAKTVNFSVTENVLKGLAPGDTVTVEKHGSTYTGSITEIASMVTPQTGLFAVEAALADAEALPDGASCKLHLVTERAQDVQLLPVDCIYYAGGEPFVYTYEAIPELSMEQGIVHRAFVTLGVSDGTNVEVVDGVDAETDIIASWTQELYEGAGVLLAREADGEAKAVETDAAEGVSEETAAQTE